MSDARGLTPAEALRAVIESSWMLPGRPGKEVPGSFLGRMPPSLREPLSRLTSEEASQVDADWVVRQRV